MISVNPDKVTLVYQDDEGNEYTQVVSDLVESGTLVNGETDEDMSIVEVLIEE